MRLVLIECCDVVMNVSVLLCAQAAIIIQEAYLNHYWRRWEASSKVPNRCILAAINDRIANSAMYVLTECGVNGQIQKWFRSCLADLAIHWVLKQLRRSVFVAQFAYSSLKVIQHRVSQINCTSASSSTRFVKQGVVSNA